MGRAQVQVSAQGLGLD